MQKQHLGLNEKEMSIGKILLGVNELSAFPLNTEQISDWAKSINELSPELELGKLKLVIDKMKMGEIEYDKGLGIQNIFLGLKSLTRPMVY